MAEHHYLERGNHFFLKWQKHVENDPRKWVADIARYQGEMLRNILLKNPGTAISYIYPSKPNGLYHVGRSMYEHVSRDVSIGEFKSRSWSMTKFELHNGSTFSCSSGEKGTLGDICIFENPSQFTAQNIIAPTLVPNKTVVINLFHSPEAQLALLNPQHVFEEMDISLWFEKHVKINHNA